QFIHGQGLDAVLRDVVRRRGRASDTDAPPAAGPPGPPTEPLVPQKESEKSSEPSHPDTAPSATTRTDLASRTEGGYYRGVARVGVQVAQALAHAHHEGVLHRDVKPSNLLLDRHGTVWVTDFGLAKLEGADELTNTGDLVGTLRYMAPERFQGRADA